MPTRRRQRRRYSGLGRTFVSQGGEYRGPPTASLLARTLGRAYLPGWTFSPGGTAEAPDFAVFYPDPCNPKQPAMSGPWKLKHDADEPEIRAAVRRAVAQVAGDELAARLRFAGDPPAEK